MTLIRLIMPEAEGFQVTETARDVQAMINSADAGRLGPMIMLTLAVAERRQTIALRADCILSAVEL